MGINYENLDDLTRKLMLQEVDLDISRGKLYKSKNLNAEGEENYETALKEAIKQYDDTWLADELRHKEYIRAFKQRRKPKGGFTTVRVPINAPETLAEGEFNRFYIRGLCLRVIDAGINEVEIYRGKQVSQPRPESTAMVGKKIPAEALLRDLRESTGVETSLGLPPGPNSGLTARIPLKHNDE